jgi:PIN domain nuclease of toxin-antitoxin system
VLIVDTHAALWFLEGDRRLSRAARRVIEDDKAQRLLSAVSVIEVAVKHRLGKLDMSADFYEAMYQQGLQALPVTDKHARRLADLPLHHRDPFDRLLVAQAQVEGMAILSADERLRAYDVPILW